MTKAIAALDYEDNDDIAQVHEQADGWFARCVPCEWDGRLHYAGLSFARECACDDATNHNLRRHPIVADLIQRNRILWHMIATDDLAALLIEAEDAGDTETAARARRAINRRINQS